ncbi:MAG: C4-dicarboxylate ABC transporter [Rhodospirillales bacterium 69-11]|mgnify:CR=1 FL=1|nr:SLAC1 anion channel family protein [Rhodospirillales bacterium]OJW25674.1 MAG: C4-dicarboxylate ABC transporter [Rhodospirillales bacterium 69-11]
MHEHAAPARRLATPTGRDARTAAGWAGLAVAWHVGAARYGVPHWIGDAIGAAAAATFVALVIAYGVKLVAAPAAVLAEFRHPVAGALFGTVLISLLLLPLVIAPVSLRLAQALWGLGAVGMVLFALTIVNRWMSDRQQIAHATPAWIVPVVGLLDLPLAIPVLQLPPIGGVSMFALSVGLFFAVPLFTVVFGRLVFEPPMPDGQKPSLLIMLAPFSVGFSCYLVTIGQADRFAEALYMLSLFMFAVLVGRLRELGRCCPFRVSWWAVGFPLAATTIAALRYADLRPNAVTDGIALVLLGFTTILLAGLALRTLLGIARGELRTLV